jgi:Asp-tRNA(Asn)/Glu-tRNA(Gln) amidotransferase A subunit family amidase
MNEILSYSATHQARLIRERKISPEELLQVHLDQVAKVNPAE